MSEDERYRTSTQYRLWSYSPQSLLSLRTTTNSIAADCVREAIQRAREARALSSNETSEVENGRSGSKVPEGEIDCLTVEEELKLVTFYCRQTLQLGKHLNVPTDVQVFTPSIYTQHESPLSPFKLTKDTAKRQPKATAVQYIKRFYITNSLMTYHPTAILKTALFFATKTENHYTRLTKFADSIGDTKPEDVLASEFLLTQGLRFTFDVRHPFRALEGAATELQALSLHDDMAILPGTIVQDEGKPHNMEKRIKAAHGLAREYLKTSALLSDVYFHFTPSQIMMASLMIADKELLSWYIVSKFPSGGAEGQEMAEKILNTLEKCAEMLRAIEPSANASAEERKECQKLAKKLKRCQNPEKVDLVALQRAKREGDEVEDEKVIKKRKWEREKVAKEGEDLFGPEIKKS